MKKLQINDKLETKRLIIEMPKIIDAKELYDLIDDDVTEFMYWWKWDSYKSIEIHIKEKINLVNEWKSWDSLVRRKEDNKIIWKFWIIKLDEDINSIELWYWIWEEYWGKWYIPGCVEFIKTYAFNKLLINRIVIIATKENIKSRKVVEKCWFKLDWILRWNGNVKWEIVDKAIYTFLKEDYIN